jgi:hypothetical protein
VEPTKTDVNYIKVSTITNKSESPNESNSCSEMLLRWRGENIKYQLSSESIKSENLSPEFKPNIV